MTTHAESCSLGCAGEERDVLLRVARKHPKRSPQQLHELLQEDGVDTALVSLVKKATIKYIRYVAAYRRSRAGSQSDDGIVVKDPVCHHTRSAHLRYGLGGGGCDQGRCRG